MNWFLFLFMSAAWGGSFLAIRFVIEVMPPFAAAGVRTAIGALIVAVLALWRRRAFPRSPKMLWQLVGLGMLNFAIPWGCLFWGEQFIEPAMASIMNSTTPIFVFLFSYFLLVDERPTWLRFSGVLLGFVGIIFVFAPSLRNFRANPNAVYGMIAVGVMALSYSLGSVLLKRIGTGLGMLWNLSVQCAAASVALLVLSVSVEPQTWLSTIWAEPRAMISILYLAAISTALCWLIFLRLLRTWGVLKASATTYVIPIVALILDWLWLDLLPAGTELVGGALIISAIGLIHFSKTRLAQD